jgi:hypothetical protein
MDNFKFSYSSINGVRDNAPKREEDLWLDFVDSISRVDRARGVLDVDAFHLRV